MMPMVSVIVPVFNGEQFLAQCLNSIINQTYPNWELLIIDDGSTDNSGTICDEFAKNAQIKTFHLKHRGPAAARNFGIENIRGDFIMFVDADDWIDDGYIEKMSEPFFTPPPNIQTQEIDFTVVARLVKMT